MVGAVCGKQIFFSSVWAVIGSGTCLPTALPWGVYTMENHDLFSDLFSFSPIRVDPSATHTCVGTNHSEFV